MAIMLRTNNLGAIDIMEIMLIVAVFSCKHIVFIS